ncbi:hypothetical protein D3C76_1292520 [compost metagenome]
MVIVLGRAAEEQSQLVNLVEDLPMPRTVMLDLPEQAAVSFPVLQHGHRNMFGGGPGACIAAGDPFGAAVGQMG